jgi:VanZ family protein
MRRSSALPLYRRRVDCAEMEPASKIGRLFRAAAWICLFAIGVLSLVKPSLRPVTVLPHNLEHAAIFALGGLAVGLGYPNRAIRNMIALTVFSGAIELAQLYAPGRHARWIDFFVDALAACLGVALALVAGRLFPRKPGQAAHS